jgi:CrcB protein
MSILVVGFGGVIGASLRFLFTPLILKQKKYIVITSTLIINIIGAFLYGAFSHIYFDEMMRLFLIVGVLGSFTTLSSVMNEAVIVLRKHDIKKSIGLILLNIVLGLLATILGGLL